MKKILSVKLSHFWAKILHIGYPFSREEVAVMQISFTYQWFRIKFKLLLVSTLMLVQVGLHIFKRTNVIRLSSGQIKTVFKIVWVLYVLQIIGIVWQGNESINVVKLWMKKNVSKSLNLEILPRRNYFSSNTQE